MDADPACPHVSISVIIGQLLALRAVVASNDDAIAEKVEGKLLNYKYCTKIAYFAAGGSPTG